MKPRIRPSPRWLPGSAPKWHLEFTSTPKDHIWRCSTKSQGHTDEPKVPSTWNPHSPTDAWNHQHPPARVQPPTGPVTQCHSPRGQQSAHGCHCPRPHQDPRLTAGAVRASPAGLAVAGVGGHAAAVHTLLRTKGCRRGKRSTVKPAVRTRSAPGVSPGPDAGDARDASLAGEAKLWASVLTHSEIDLTSVLCPSLFS